MKGKYVDHSQMYYSDNTHNYIITNYPEFFDVKSKHENVKNIIYRD